MTYVLLAALALVRYVRSSSDRARISAAVLAALAILLAYEAKITNLFFMPGIAIAILLYSKGKGLKDALAYGGVLAGLYLAETAAYAP
jgi:4-hydroxybenzoate polyprenyltransferase